MGSKIVFCVIITIIGIEAQTLIRSWFPVRNTGGIINFVEIPENSTEITSLCRLQIQVDPTEITIDLNEFVENPYKLKSGENIKKTSSDLCGVRMYPISETMHESKFNLIMEYSNGTSINNSFYLDVYEKIETSSPVNISFFFTDYYYLPYTSKYHEYEDEFGNIINTANIQFFNVEINSDKWIGRGLVNFQMDEIITVYNIIEYDSKSDNKNTELTTIETQQSRIFRCVLDLTNQYLGICYARKPNGSIIGIESGLLNDKYSTYDSQPIKGICSIEIFKPFDETEKGIWQILMPSANSGCMFSIDGEIEKQTRIDNILATANTPIQLDIDISKPIKTVTIKCEYPDEIVFCVLHNPNGDIEIKDYQNTATTLVLGYCSYDVTPIAGKWKCSIKVQDSEILITTHYQMNLFNGSYITTKNSDQKRLKGESIELGCSTTFKVEYCIFESPAGVWYTLSENIRDETSRISYVGRGLRYGDCLVKIANIQQNDFGNWTCHIKLLAQKNKYYITKILLIEHEVISSAVVLGVSIGIGLMLVAIIMRYSYARYKTRRNNSSEIVIE